jgi:hypothetical protein
VELLSHPGADRSRITLTESPLEPGIKAKAWPVPADKALNLEYLDEGPHTKGHLLPVRATLTVKNGKWDMTVLPPALPGAGPKSAGDRGPASYMVYYFRAIQNPKSDEGPVRLMVLLRFEGGRLVNVFKVDVDVEGALKPNGAKP